MLEFLRYGLFIPELFLRDSLNFLHISIFNVEYKLNLFCSRYMTLGCKSTYIYPFTAVPGNIVPVVHVPENPNTFKGLLLQAVG